MDPQSEYADGARPKSGDGWRAAQLAADIASGARTAAPRMKSGALRFGDWLARVGWGKFFLLALLLLIASAILNSWLFDAGPAIVVDASDPKDRVNVVVSVSPEGIRIAPPVSPKAPALPAAAGAPATPAVGDSGATPAAPASNVRPTIERPKEADVRIDQDGVRIVASKDGKQIRLKIDSKGVQLEEVAPGSAAGAARSGDTSASGAVIIGSGALADPDQVAAAVEAARGRIEELVHEQVNRQVARTTRVYREQSSDWFMSFILLIILTSIIVKIVLGSKRKAETRAQAASATAAEEGLKRQLAEAQLKMMQAQVEPHFLFNTMASVDYLIETDPARASTMQKNLIQYLRAALPQMREGSTTLGKELALVRAYLEILKVRMDDRLQFSITVPQGLMSAQFPPMMLQSLVENAIRHALEPKPEGGSIAVTADIASGSLRVTVADTGLGFGAAGQPGTGVGLSNVRERLAALYGGRAKFTIEANSPSGTIATIEVPYEADLGRDDGATWPTSASAAA